MVRTGCEYCPDCGGHLKYYDTVRRIVRTKARATRSIYIRRVRCIDCRKLHRELPDIIFPFKQYEAEIIRGVLENLITPETLGYEDSPCEMTMVRWKASQELRVLL